MFHLQVTIRFASDRYHGSDWPPSPARLFQALVAGAKVGAPAREWGANHQQALEWLEALGAPTILARPGVDAQPYTLFVPNNSLEQEHSTRTSKQVSPTLLASHSPGGPDVVYYWPVSDPDFARAHLPALELIASRLRVLGWGVDFAAAVVKLEQAAPAENGLEPFEPSARGSLTLRIPKPGLLAHLSERHRAFTGRISREGVNPYTKPTDFGQARYRRMRAWQPRRWIAFEMLTPDGDGLAIRWDQTQTVAAWLRHAAAEALLQEELDTFWVNSYVLGHTDTGDHGYRLSYAPLPSVGHKHSDGGIRRTMIVEPPSAHGSDAEALDLLRVKLSGWTLIDEDRRTRRAVLTPLADAGKVLPFYTRKACVWQTVTPVILHGHNAARGRISVAKTDRLLRQAFEAAGFPEGLIHEMSFQTAPYWQGCEAANALRVPQHLAQWPRLHVRVRFEEAVEGPVLAGIGRHYGIGVFAARAEA